MNRPHAGIAVRHGVMAILCLGLSGCVEMDLQVSLQEDGAVQAETTVISPLCELLGEEPFNKLA